jgi:uncharacterized membrane protein YeaQ/YmgE (transglycosylase-associated protein family)
MSILFTLIVGCIAGWLGSLIFRGSGFGLIGNIVIGILGSFVGTWFLGLLNFSFGGGTLGLILTGATGAIVILAIANLIFPSRR